jgi:hypothetical protein
MSIKDKSGLLYTFLEACLHPVAAILYEIQCDRKYKQNLAPQEKEPVSKQDLAP